jgi:hypothetical protein
MGSKRQALRPRPSLLAEDKASAMRPTALGPHRGHQCAVHSG